MQKKHWFFMRSFIAVAAGLSITCATYAEDLRPDALVKGVTDEVLEIVRSDKDIQSGNTRKVVELIETRVLPQFDFMRMTSLALGRAWRQTTPAQQKVLSDEFKTLLVRTYSNALTAYRNQTIDFKPVKMAPADTEVTVRTEIRQPGAKSITIDYALEKSGATWKVYDVIVGGISLVTSYRDQFAQEIRGNGIDGLIKALRTKNGTPLPAVARQ